MVETIGTLAIMGIIGFFVVFGGYIIIMGDKEEARQRKANKAKHAVV